MSDDVFYQARELISKHRPKLLAVDGNLSPETLKEIVSESLRNSVDGKPISCVS